MPQGGAPRLQGQAASWGSCYAALPCDPLRASFRGSAIDIRTAQNPRSIATAFAKQMDTPPRPRTIALGQ